MSYWIKFFLLFFAGCFFLLPALNVEDPFRSLSLRFFSKETEAEIYNHSCKPDRIYLYQYNINGKNYKQRYDGYVESIDQLIPEQERCKEAVASLPKMQIRHYFHFGQNLSCLKDQTCLCSLELIWSKFFPC